MRRKLIAFSLVSAFILSACGVKGQLDTPPPLWGEQTTTDQPEKADTPAE